LSVHFTLFTENRQELYRLHLPTQIQIHTANAGVHFPLYGTQAISVPLCITIIFQS